VRDRRVSWRGKREEFAFALYGRDSSLSIIRATDVCLPRAIASCPPMEASWLGQRVLAKPVVLVDDRRQFPARPLKDIDDALGLVEVVMKVFQRRFAHRPTPHPRGLLRGVADALLDEDPLDDVNAASPRPPMSPNSRSGFRGGKGFYVGGGLAPLDFSLPLVGFLGARANHFHVLRIASLGLMRDELASVGARGEAFAPNSPCAIVARCPSSSTRALPWQPRAIRCWPI